MTKKIFLVIIFLITLVLALYYSFKTKGDVATMVAGLWSALATVILGAIALFQSRQYKKLSDKATVDYHNLQIEIKELTNNMATAINTLQRIEKAKYFPNLELWNYKIFGINKKNCKEIVEDRNNVMQLNYINIDQDEFGKEITYFVGKYNIFAFCIKNIGEKTIMNFNCEDISIPSIIDKWHGHAIIYSSCDIKPGQFVFVFLINIPSYSSLDGKIIKMVFRMDNLISDTYICRADLLFYLDDENIPSAHINELFPESCNENRNTFDDN